MQKNFTLSVLNIIQPEFIASHTAMCGVLFYSVLFV